MIAENPNVCLQVEAVVDDGRWQSAIVTGTAEELKGAKREEALKVILTDNPGLTPAVSLRWRNNWITENIEVIYRIRPTAITGRFAMHVETRAAVGGGRRADR
jgi:nitroimidazol reductase NimA-like FMN-containing flavoprotein (pyridoxamine 5'-phosphate oxidase superfamily)